MGTKKGSRRVIIRVFSTDEAPVQYGNLPTATLISDGNRYSFLRTTSTSDSSTLEIIAQDMSRHEEWASFELWENGALVGRTNDLKKAKNFLDGKD